MQKENRTYAIKIVYNVWDRYECAYISEFLKMCGFFVLEEDVPDENLEPAFCAEDAKWYDSMLYLGVSKDAFDRLDERMEACGYQKQSWIGADPGFLNQYKENNAGYLQTYLENIVKNVLRYPDGQISGLISIYVNEEYCRLSYIKRYFGKAVDANRKTFMYNALLRIIASLTTAEKNISDERVAGCFLHAKFLCKRKVNDICNYLGLNNRYPPKKMIEKCLAVYQKQPVSPSVYTLAASFATCNAAFRDNVIPFYKDALKGQEDNPAYANVYYRMGWYYENHLEDMARANDAYDKACGIAPGYVRTLFKKGTKRLNQKRYTSAIEAYQSAIKVLDGKRKKGRMFPVEYEYMCKCYLLIALIYDVYWNDPGECRSYERRAYQLIERELDESPFFGDFLGDAEGEYIEHLCKRIELRRYIIMDNYKNDKSTQDREIIYGREQE